MIATLPRSKVLEKELNRGIDKIFQLVEGLYI